MDQRDTTFGHVTAEAMRQLDEEMVREREQNERLADTRGRVNGYQCDSCGRTVYTVDRDVGTTPMFMGCIYQCGGRMASMMYRVAGVQPVREWYRPKTERELREVMAAATPETEDHLMRGGLMLREIPEARLPDEMEAQQLEEQQGFPTSSMAHHDPKVLGPGPGA